jgi:hypothetical protein
MTNKSKRMKRSGRSTLIMFEMDGDKILDNYLPYQRKLKRPKKRYQAKNKKEAA